MRAEDSRGHGGAKRYSIRSGAIMEYVDDKDQTVSKRGDINRRGKTTQLMDYPNTVYGTLLALFRRMKSER